MADNSSNSVAIVAIVIIVIAALGAGYYFMNQNGGMKSNAPTKVEVNLPSPSSAAEPTK